MARCNYCGTTILFGGARDGEVRYCNARCQQSGRLLAVSNQFPQAQVQEQIWKVHQGACPKCGGSGPVDVHKSYRVWSALVLTQWSSLMQVSCRHCGLKKQMADAGFSLLLGWWDFPGDFSLRRSKSAAISGAPHNHPNPRSHRRNSKRRFAWQWPGKR